MVIDDIQVDFDGGFMKGAHKGFKFFWASIRFVKCKKMICIIAPEVAIFLAKRIDRHEFDGGDAEIF